MRRSGDGAGPQAALRGSRAIRIHNLWELCGTNTTSILRRRARAFLRSSGRSSKQGCQQPSHSPEQPALSPAEQSSCLPAMLAQVEVRPTAQGLQVRTAVLKTSRHS